MAIGNRVACLSIAVLVALSSGCASVAPRTGIPDAAARHHVGQAPTPAALDADVLPGTPNRQWWKDFSDPNLDALVSLAMRGNHDLKSALAAVVEARALAGAARKDYLPSGALQVKAEAMQSAQIEADPYRQDLPRPPSQRLLSAGQMFSWELDLFGRIGTAAAMADRKADAAAADARSAAAVLQAEVAKNYFLLRMDQINLASLEREVELSKARVVRVKARYAAGLVDRREALAVESEHAELVAQEAATATRLQADRAALAVLAGRSPTAQDDTWEALLAPAPLPAPPDLASLAQPTDLLARRPDVAKADALLRASLGNVVLAERAHLPRLTLNVFGGILAPFGSLGDSSAKRFSAGPELQWEWLSFGRKKAREEAARAGSDQNWHAFEQTVLTALKESEDSLHAWTSSQIRMQQAVNAEALSGRSSAYASSRVDAGIEPKDAGLQQQALHEKARRELAAAQAGLLMAHVQVQLALGAWQPEKGDPEIEIGRPIASRKSAESEASAAHH